LANGEKENPAENANREKTEIAFPSSLESIDEAVIAVAGAATSAGFDDTALFGIDLAMREAMVNAVKHGNKLDETKTVRISFEKTPEMFEIIVRDEGEGFDFENLPDPTDPANLLKESGRGAFLIRNFMDEVEWKLAPTGGTILRMTKKF
jgi:serine/threonine-protein kinase RsbW